MALDMHFLIGSIFELRFSLIPSHVSNKEMLKTKKKPYTIKWKVIIQADSVMHALKNRGQ